MMQKNNLWRYSLFLAFLTTLSFSCRSTPTGPHVTQNVVLSTDYVACTEVWLRVSFGDTLGGNFAINRDGNTVLTGHFSGADTTVIDTTALPEKTYNYVCWRMVNGLPKNSSSNLQVQTMDTSGNNFTWQTFTFGGNAGGCLLKDVAIINDTDIWAVGEIPLKDSSVNGYSVYNLVRWDGTSWQLRKVQFLTFCGQSYTGSYPASAIFAFGPQDVWIASGSQVVRWNGTSQSSPMCIPSSVNKLWGTSDENIYAGGANGGIAHYDGSVWEKIESGTSLDIHDIWGTSDSTTGQEEVLAVASDQFTNNGVAVLQLSGTEATMLQTCGLPTTSLVGIWSANGREWYVCGDGLYKTRALGLPWQKVKGIPPIEMEAIRGTGPNDIFVVGDFGLVLHWNGASWHEYTGNELPYIQGSYLAVAAKGNTVVAVGFYGGQAGNQPAVALIGRRN